MRYGMDLGYCGGAIQDGFDLPEMHIRGCCRVVRDNSIGN